MQFSHQISRGYVALRFPGKPSAAVRQCLKSHGFRWSPTAGEWWRRRVEGAADVIGAVRDLLERESGNTRPDGACWTCQDPRGYFRRRGAAAPVWCDACDAKVREREAAEAAAAAARVALDVDRLFEDDCARRCGA